MKLQFSAFVVVCMLAAHSPLQAASFDCNKASTTLEKTICSDSGLNRLDELLGRSYRKVSQYCKNATQRDIYCPVGIDSFKRTHQAWLKYRLVKCDASDVPCLESLYSDYIKELQAKTSLSALFAGAWQSLHDSKPSALGTEGHLECFSYIYGYKLLYCDVRRSFHYPRLQQISGVNLFKAGGPHGKVLDFSNKTQFGHYNPHFLSWMTEYMIPEDKNDPRYSPFAQAVYDRQNVKEMARLLYVSHQLIFAEGKALDTLLLNYKRVAQNYRERLSRREVFEGRFYGPHMSTETIRQEYIDQLAKAQAGNLPGGINVGWELGEDLRWLADYLATTQGYNWYAAITAGSYWIRRSIDGTEAQLFSMLSNALAVYDNDFIQENSVAQRIPAQACNYNASRPIALVAGKGEFDILAYYSADACAEATLHLVITDIGSVGRVYETYFSMAGMAMYDDLPEGEQLLAYAKHKADQKLADLAEPNSWPPFNRLLKNPHRITGSGKI